MGAWLFVVECFFPFELAASLGSFWLLLYFVVSLSLRDGLADLFLYHQQYALEDGGMHGHEPAPDLTNAATLSSNDLHPYPYPRWSPSPLALRQPTRRSLYLTPPF